MRRYACVELMENCSNTEEDENGLELMYERPTHAFLQRHKNATIAQLDIVPQCVVIEHTSCCLRKDQVCYLALEQLRRGALQHSG